MDTTREVTIEPVEGESHEGRQWGYNILLDGVPVLRAWTGGTGPCWNIEDAEDVGPGQEPDQFHICELDEFIAALVALRDSEAHRANVERWA